MRILRLRLYGYPEVIAASAMAEDIDHAFETNDIVSINYMPIPSRGISEEVRQRYRRIYYEELQHGHVIVHRFPMFRERPIALLKIVRALLCSLIEYRKGIQEDHIDLIFGFSTLFQGNVCAHVARRLQQRYGHPVPFVYCVQDIFPDSLVTAGFIRRGSLLWKIGRKMEDAIYQAANRIIVISEDFRTNLLAKGVPADKIVVIPNWGDTDGIYPVKREENTLFDQYGLDRKLFYITYAGTIGHQQNMEVVLDAAKDLKDELPDLRFVLIGEGAAKADMEHRIEQEQISNVRLLPFQSYDRMPEVFSLGDVGLISCKPGVGSIGVPSKTWNIMAAEKPILASFDRDSSLARLIDSMGCGVTAQAGDGEALKNAIRDLYADKHLVEMGQKGKHYLLTELNKDKCVKQYIDTFKSVLI